MTNINLLENNKIPSPSANLVDRIVNASYNIEQQPNIWRLLMSLFAEFKIPNPAYSFLTLLAIGFIMSGTSGQNVNETTIISQLYQYEQYVEELL